jgi:hypothetical protein
MGLRVVHCQYTHGSVVIVEHFALRGLANQLFVSRLKRRSLSDTISHCVAAGKGIRNLACSPSN